MLRRRRVEEHRDITHLLSAAHKRRLLAVMAEERKVRDVVVVDRA